MKIIGINGYFFDYVPHQFIKQVPVCRLFTVFVLNFYPHEGSGVRVGEMK